MSKHVNMTGHYKIAGRERQGEGILQSSEKGAYAQQRHEERLQAIQAQAGPPAWETTPPNLEVADKPKPSAQRKTRKSRTGKRTRKATAGRKPMPTRKATATRKATPTRKAATKKKAASRRTRSARA
jgi:hypothetical protein